MKTTLQILTDGLALIRDPKHWCQEVLAKSQDGSWLEEPTDPRACSWCSIGALMKVEERKASGGADYDSIAHLEGAASRLGFQPQFFARTNDAVFHEDIVRIWEKAIENCARNPEKCQGQNH